MDKNTSKSHPPHHQNHHNIRVWDISLRLFHWLLVIGITVQYLTMNFGEGAYTKWHFQMGFVVLGLVIYRIIWGVIGSETAKFSQFIRSPSVVFQYVKQFFSKQYQFHVGHNPLGAISVIALLGNVLVMAVTGLFIGDDIIWFGPLNGTVSSDTTDLLHEIHEIGQTVLLWIIGIHVAAILYYKLRKDKNLVTAMVTGDTPAPNHVKQPRMRSGLVGVILLIICVSVSFYYFNGKI